MIQAFPEAMVSVPPELLRAVECIPDEEDRHVLAAAIMARADTIVTQNTKHFPKELYSKNSACFVRQQMIFSSISTTLPLKLSWTNWTIKERGLVRIAPM